MAARTLLLKLEERGFIQLPARRWTPPNRMRDKRVPALDPNVSQEPIHTALANLLPLEVREVSAGVTADRRLFDALLHRFHYLSYRSPVGDYAQLGIMRSCTRRFRYRARETVPAAFGRLRATLHNQRLSRKRRSRSVG
jgi:hypothetical protein